MKIEQRIVNIKEIKIPPRFRKNYGDLKELAKSIQDKGIIQPLSLNKNMELAAGGRRYAAAILAEVTEIPVIIRDTSEEIDRLEIELFENIHRKDMEWHEEVELTNAIDAMYKDKHGEDWSGRKTAGLLNKSVGGVSENLKLSQAISVLPDLKRCKTRKDALKFLSKVDENQQIEEARTEQKERMKIHNNSNLARAESNFNIQDCFDGIQEVIDNYREMKTHSMINIIEVDPPYAIDLAEVKKKEGITSDELERYKEISKEEYPCFLSNLSKILFEAAAPDTWVIFWFGPTWFTETKAALIAAGFRVDDIPGIWVKGSEGTEGAGQTNQPQTYLARAYEPFFIARKGNPMIHKKGRSNIFSFSPVSASKKYHPTQRPIELISEILETFAWPGSIVMVPFLGSGTTLRAAYKMDMNAFGYELNKENKDYFMLQIEEDEKDDRPEKV